MPRRIGVDETSFQKRHEYVTLVVDLDNPPVLFVADDRKKASLDPFYQGLRPRQLEELQAVAMDMWEPFIRSTLDHVPDAEKQICSVRPA